MLHERIDTARPIAKKIGEAEKSFNQSLQLIGELLSDIPRARQKFAGRIPLTAGVAASECLAAAAVSATRAYKDVIEAHAHLAQDRDQVGLRTVSIGDIGACPENGSLENVPHHLSVVKAA